MNELLFAVFGHVVDLKSTVDSSLLHDTITEAPIIVITITLFSFCLILI